MHEWEQINAQLKPKKDEAANLMIKKWHSILGIVAGGLVIIAGFGLANNPDTKDIVYGSATVVAGAALVAKASLDRLIIIPTKTRELADQLGLTPDEIDWWYTSEYDDML